MEAADALERCDHKKDHLHVGRAPQLVFLQVGVALVLSLVLADLARAFGLEGNVVHVPDSLGGGAFRLTLFPLLALVFCLRPLILWRDSYHEIGCHHLRGESGRISFRKQSVEVPFEDIRGVRVVQTLFQRIINVGDVIVWTAFSELPEVSLRCVSSPKRVASEISRHLDKARMSRS